MLAPTLFGMDRGDELADERDRNAEERDDAAEASDRAQDALDRLADDRDAIDLVAFFEEETSKLDRAAVDDALTKIDWQAQVSSSRT
jgi:hypothetical protein